MDILFRTFKIYRLYFERIELNKRNCPEAELRKQNEAVQVIIDREKINSMRTEHKINCSLSFMQKSYFSEEETLITVLTEGLFKIK